MAGGAPVPVPLSDPQVPILCVADLKEAASKRLPDSARGNILKPHLSKRSLVAFSHVHRLYYLHLPYPALFLSLHRCLICRV